MLIFCWVGYGSPPLRLTGDEGQLLHMAIRIGNYDVLRYLLSVPGLKVRGGGQGNALRRVNTEEREHIIVLGLGWIPGSV